MEQPVILCGLGRVGGCVLESLRNAGLSVVAVDLTCSPDDPRLKDVRLIRGDCRERDVLELAGIGSARGVIVCTSDDHTNILTALLIRRLHAEVRIVLRMFNPELGVRLGRTVRNMFVLSVSALTAPMMATIVMTGNLITSFELEDGMRQIVEVKVDPGSHWVGRTINEFMRQYCIVVLGHAGSGRRPLLFAEMDANSRIIAEDELVICGTVAAVATALEACHNDPLPTVLWAGRARRYSRLARRTFGEIDLSVKIALGVLLGVVTISTLIYHWGLGLTWADGLYRTISVIATGADMRGEQFVGWQKVFISILRLLGTAIVAAFTAILTNYLIRARLRGVFEVSRIPDGGHVIICGLGNVGFRIVDELIRVGEQVVIVQKDADARFVSTARALGAAIIIGDATISEILRQTNVHTARAVIAGTSEELVNLEIAMLVRELNPDARVVVRTVDPNFAETLREAAGVRDAVAVPALAASAFMAGLYGDRMISMLLLYGHVLGVMELQIQEGDPCLAGENLRAAAIDYQFAPILMSKRPIDSLDLATHRLKAGDHLTVIVRIAEIARLLRREQAPREWQVEIEDSAPEARDRLKSLLCQRRNCTPEEAEALCKELPIRLEDRFTRGQAEDLIRNLQRDRIQARAVAMTITTSPTGTKEPLGI